MVTIQITTSVSISLRNNSCSILWLLFSYLMFFVFFGGYNSLWLVCSVFITGSTPNSLITSYLNLSRCSDMSDTPSITCQLFNFIFGRNLSWSLLTRSTLCDCLYAFIIILRILISTHMLKLVSWMVPRSYSISVYSLTFLEFVFL